MKKRSFRIPALLLLVALLCTVFAACGGKGDVKRYDVIFESNGGTMYYTVRAAAGDTVELPAPEREGYSFAGWYGDSEMSGEALSGSYTVGDRDATLYAKWDPYTGTVIFESNGGTQYEELSFAAQRIELPTPVKEGFLFGGWFVNEALTGEALTGALLPTGDVTLYAKWELVTGTVIFESNGGTRYESVAVAGQKVQLPTPKKEGYLFAGWYDNAEFSGKAYVAEYVPVGSVTLYARWASNHILVALEENGGQAVDDIRLFDNDTLTLPTPERWGYRFVGWFDNEELSGVPVDDYFYYPAQDVTLYAKWEKCSYLYLFYGPTKMDWVRVELDVGASVSLDELYEILEPEAITVKDYRGFEHVAPFEYWAYQGEDETSHIRVTSDVTVYDEFLILVAQYDESSVPADEYLTYDRETDDYTTTGKVAHVFIEDVTKTPYAYTIGMSFRRDIGGGVGPAFRMNVSNANYHYESGCDYLSPVISPDNGSLYIASVLAGKWSYFVTSIDISLLPKAWQQKFNTTPSGGLIEMTMTVADYGTWFEVYIDNDLAYTYTDASKLASYRYDDLGVRSSSTPTRFTEWSVTYGYEVSFDTGVSGLTVASKTWLCGDVELPVVTRDGYALAGWYYDESCTQPVDYEDFFINKDTALYAKWSDTYSVVSFDTKGGTACSDINYAGGKIVLPESTKMNYIFTGWYYNEACTQLVDADTFTTDTNVTLYAGWRLPYTHLVKNADGSYTYNKKTEAVLGTLDTGIPAEGTYHEFSQTITMVKGAGSVGIAFRMNMNKDYTYETAGTDYLSIQFCVDFFRVSYVQNGEWRRLLPANADYAASKMPQNWRDKYASTATGGKITVKLTIRDYGSYFEAYVDGDLAYTYGDNGETVDLTEFTGNGYGVRCSAGTEVIFDDITAKVVNVG